MKKKWLLPIMGLLLLVLTACSSNKTATTTTTKPKVESAFYNDLKTQDKKKVQFKFSESQDETQDNLVYVVSMKVTNKTNKIVKFDQSKFLIFVDEQTKFKSAKKGTLTLRPGTSKTLNQLFENVSSQGLSGNGSEFIYLNKSNKLAGADFAKVKKTQQTSSNQNSTTDTNTNDNNTSTGNANTTSANNSNSNTNSSDGNQVATDNNSDESNPDDAHDGHRSDRILVWTSQYMQDGLDQGMSEEDAQNYGYNIALQKEDEYEANNQ